MKEYDFEDLCAIGTSTFNEFGEMFPTFVGVSDKDKKVYYHAFGYNDDKEKHRMLGILSMFCICFDIDRYGMMHEGWLIKEPPGVVDDEGNIPAGFVMPSERPDRLEIVSIAYNTRTSHHGRTYKILRDGEKPRLELHMDSEVSPRHKFHGTFNELLLSEEKLAEVPESKKALGKMLLPILMKSGLQTLDMYEPNL
jgi:hypothetical protein